MEIGIIGSGAMGSLFAYLLAKSGKNPWLLDINRDWVDKVRKDGLAVEGISGNHTVKVKITTDPGEIKILDLAVLFVKSYDTEKAVKDALSLVGENTIVLTLQNGLGNIEKIGRVIGMENILGGITSQGATVLEKGRIRHAGRGETVIGEMSGKITDRLRKVLKIFNQAEIRTEASEDVVSLIWSKLLINAGINALTAITRLKNGRLLDFPETREILRQAVEEAIRVSRAKGIKIIYPDPVKKVESVCEKTHDNISSMLQDVLNNKKTEIDAINGAIVSEGKRLGISTPINKILTNLVVTLEKTANI